MMSVVGKMKIVSREDVPALSPSLVSQGLGKDRVALWMMIVSQADAAGREHVGCHAPLIDSVAQGVVLGG